jgi:hypothetical protein
VHFPFICSNIPAAPAYGVYLRVDLIFQSCFDLVIFFHLIKLTPHHLIFSVYIVVRCNEFLLKVSTGTTHKCVKFDKNPISGLGGVALTRYMDGRIDGRTDLLGY